VNAGHLSLNTIGFSQSDQVKILFSPDKLPAPHSTSDYTSCIQCMGSTVDDVTLQFKVEVTAVSSYP